MLHTFGAFALRMQTRDGACCISSGDFVYGQLDCNVCLAVWET
jgi:hypothetical protein